MPFLSAGRLWTARFCPRNRNAHPDPHCNIHHLRKPDVDVVTNRHGNCDRPRNCYRHRDSINGVRRLDQLHNHGRGFDV